MGKRDATVLLSKREKTRHSLVSPSGSIPPSTEKTANKNSLATNNEDNRSFIDPLGVHPLFGKVFTHLIKQPEKCLEITRNFWEQSLTLSNGALNTLTAQKEVFPTHVTPPSNDRRFKEASWTEIPSFNLIMQSYLLLTQWVHSMLPKIEGLNAQEAKKLRFYSQQLLDALAPTNCPWTNPKVLNKAIETNGQSLINGMTRLLQDLQKGLSLTNIQNVDNESFRVGENLATTKGKVVFQNDLIQLIHYHPLTEETYTIPLLIIPAWINKFYLFDLQEHNSFVQWALKQGFTVFIISWINPDPNHAHITFEDYMRLGPLTALEIIQAMTQVPKINAVGSCLGGTLLSCVLGSLGKEADTYFNSATFLTPLFDFSKAGDLLLFTDKDHLQLIEERLDALGYLDGRTLAATFNMLRSNDLIWSAFINNYLLDEELPRLDFLYWNADNTNLPATMYRFYLQEFFQNNAFMNASNLRLLDSAVHLKDVSVPTFILSTRDDHIAPWISGYAGTRLFGGENTFVLAGSGHIAGVINPPFQQKYGYWVNKALPKEAEDWLASAFYHPGSWWEVWGEWLKERSGPSIPARIPLDGLEDAPGSYVYKAWNENHAAR